MVYKVQMVIDNHLKVSGCPGYSPVRHELMVENLCFNRLCIQMCYTQFPYFYIFTCTDTVYYESSFQAKRADEGAERRERCG